MGVLRLDPGFLAESGDGEWKGGLPSKIAGLSNDTRSLQQDELFLALATDRRDGHDFLDTAKSKGASGAIVERFVPDVDLPQLVVSNVGDSIVRMATEYRKKWSFPVVGVTGSCGKTTCKDLLAAILDVSKTHSTKGNLNNLLGVPMSVLRPIESGVRYSVMEAGISEVGEMAQLASIIDPEIAVVTAIGPSHLEKLGTEQSVAIEKGILGQGERVKTVFAGETCERYAGYLGGLKVKLVRRNARLSEEWSYRFGSESGRTYLEQNVWGETERYEYEGTGNGLASNFAIANAVAHTLGVSSEMVRTGLLSWKPSALRGEWKTIGKCQVYLDCYNANPISMKDSLDTFVSETSEELPRLFIVGCMEELGESSPAYHEQMGIEFPFRGMDRMLLIGDDSDSIMRGLSNMGYDLSSCSKIGSIEQAKASLAEFEGSVFLKGSRRYQLERALDHLKVESTNTIGT